MTIYREKCFSLDDKIYNLNTCNLVCKLTEDRIKINWGDYEHVIWFDDPKDRDETFSRFERCMLGEANI